MNKILQLDSIIRQILSYFYRLIVFIYALLIVFTNENSFPVLCYFLTFIGYGGISYLLIGKEGWHSKLRLFLDTTFTIIILFDKNISCVVNIVFLLLPAINMGNHSGKKKSYILVYLLIFISAIVIDAKQVNFSLLIPFIALVLITFVQDLRNRIFNFYYSLSNSISEFSEQKKPTDREYKVYESITNKFNISKFSSLCKIETIICIQVIPNGYFLLNGSKFILEVDIDNLEVFLNGVSTGKLFSNHKISVDGVVSNENIIIPVNDVGKGYVFILITPHAKHILNAIPRFRDEIFLGPLLAPFFKELAIFLESQHEIFRNRMTEFKKIRGNYSYVLRTINAIHFIRNRLSPLKNFLVAEVDYNRNDDPEDMKLKLRRILNRENESAQASLTEILTRAKQILEGSNPFDVTSDIEKVKIKSIYSELRSLCYEVIGTETIEHNLRDFEFEKEVKVSRQGIIIVFSDLINNINKYYDGEYLIKFFMENNELKICFTNNINTAKSDTQKMNQLIAYFESEERDSIFKMSSKGVFFIKDYLKQMRIHLRVELLNTNKTFLSVLTFKTYENTSS